MKTKDLILGLREELSITKEIAKILFSGELEKRESMKVLNFYNLVKKIVIRSGDSDRMINIKIFWGLIRELRLKLDIFKVGLGPDKTMMAIDLGLDIDYENFNTDNSYEAAKNRQKRVKRIEKAVLIEFSTINISRVHDALVSAE